MDPNTFPTKGNLILAKNSLALAKQVPQKNCLNAPKKRKSIYGEFPVIAPIKGRKNCSLLQMDAPVLLRLDAVSIKPVLPLISPARMKTMN